MKRPTSHPSLQHSGQSAVSLSLLSDADLRAAFWAAQRDALETLGGDPLAYGAAIARKQAILSEQRCRRTLRAS